MGPTGLNASVTPLLYDIVGTNVSARNSGTYQASFTGGSGGVTYNWQNLSTDAGLATFQNPVNSSSQIIRLSGISVGTMGTATARCRLTDSQGNISYTDYVTFIYTNESFA